MGCRFAPMRRSSKMPASTFRMVSSSMADCGRPQLGAVSTDLGFSSGRKKVVLEVQKQLNPLPRVKYLPLLWVQVSTLHDTAISDKVGVHSWSLVNMTMLYLYIITLHLRSTTCINLLYIYRFSRTISQICHSIWWRSHSNSRNKSGPWNP